MAGRGGAGNILALQQQAERVADDVEANRKPQDEISDLPEVSSTREEQQYAYTGRGGAGNYYVPKELEKTGHFNNAHRSHILGDGTAAPVVLTTDQASKVDSTTVVPQPSRWQGRGGAGNYSWAAAEHDERAQKKKLEDEREREEKLKADIEKGVSDNLAMPEKAKLTGTEDAV